MYQKNNDVKDFEFYYLVELTRRKIKPLSRWEKPLTVNTHQWLKNHGLYVELIPRKTLSGKDITETVFSTSTRYTDLYLKRFCNTYLSKSAGNQSLEGFLFGYPSCCVKQFIRYPYFPSSLDSNTQSMLFHWACNSCRSTPELIPYYQSAYKNIYDWYKTEYKNKILGRTYRRTINKVLASLLLSGSLLSAQTAVDSTHYIQLPDDLNENSLSYAEEIFLGVYDHGFSYEDCQTYARMFKAIIDTLPNNVQTDRAYKIEHLLRGIVQCPKCGLNVNMGYVTIVNPLRNMQMDIPYLGLHYMEMGFFSYGTDTDYQRIDIDTLKKMLYPFNLQHLLPVAGDSDGDGLTDAEEDSLWIGDTASNPDVNADSIPDGVEIAEELTRLFPKLKEQTDSIHSSIKFMPVYGMENCQICGSLHNMGYIEITNPENKRTYQIPYISLHAMAHGSFAFNGTEHGSQRIDAVELYRTMKTHSLFIGGDKDNDGLKDNEDDYFCFDPDKADSDNDGLYDGMELAAALVDKIKALPTVPSLDHPYAEYLDMDGIQLCSVCGDIIPMGVIRIYNPLINTVSPIELSYYALHFLQKGSFASEGADNTRIDPITLSEYLNSPTGVNADNTALKFELSQNYPNPFNPVTTIVYKIPAAAHVSLAVYNLLGQKVISLFEGARQPGNYKAVFDSKGLSSGVYFYRLHADIKTGGQTKHFIETKRLLLLK
ncbi:MAG: T9SS type A sorting domain-containing protein [Bacteroidetes bacterium]|nr:T9SS type A sorting domain-containing protein [Bacteroidota bacterium]